MAIEKANKIEALHYQAIKTIVLMFISKRQDLSAYYNAATMVESNINAVKPDKIFKDLQGERGVDFKMSLPNYYYIISKARDVKSKIENHKDRNKTSDNIISLIDLCFDDFYKNRDKILREVKNE